MKICSRASRLKQEKARLSRQRHHAPLSSSAAEPVLLGLMKHLAYAEAELSKSLQFPCLDWFPPCPEMDDLQAMEDCVVT